MLKYIRATKVHTLYVLCKKYMYVKIAWKACDNVSDNTPTPLCTSRNVRMLGGRWSLLIKVCTKLTDIIHHALAKIRPRPMVWERRKKKVGTVL